MEKSILLLLSGPCEEDICRKLDPLYIVGEYSDIRYCSHPAAGRHIVPRLLPHLTDQQIVQKAENFSSKFFRNCWESSICIVVCQVCLIFWPLLTPRARRKSGGNGGNFSPVCAGFGKRQRAPVFSPNEQCPKLGSACSKVSLGRIFETLLEKPPTPVNNLWPKRGGCDKK